VLSFERQEKNGKISVTENSTKIVCKQKEEIIIIKSLRIPYTLVLTRQQSGFQLSLESSPLQPTFRLGAAEIDVKTITSSSDICYNANTGKI
jgi:hypothetical protein